MAGLKAKRPNTETKSHLTARLEVDDCGGRWVADGSNGGKIERRGVRGEREITVRESENEKEKAREIDRKSTRLNSSHESTSRMPSSA